VAAADCVSISSEDDDDDPFAAAWRAIQALRLLPGAATAKQRGRNSIGNLLCCRLAAVGPLVLGEDGLLALAQKQFQKKDTLLVTCRRHAFQACARFLQIHGARVQSLVEQRAGNVVDAGRVATCRAVVWVGLG
jgi:hypothetical protein